MRNDQLPSAIALASRRDFLKYASAFSASGLLGACSKNASPGAEKADVIFRGGPIITMNERSLRAEALAVRSQRIVAVGSMAEVEMYRGSNTRIVDLGGRALLPGLIDPHMHTAFARTDDWIVLSSLNTPSYDKVLATLREGVAKARAGDWILAQGYDRATVHGARSPSLAEMDAIAPNNPMFIMEANGHVAYANSQGLKAANVKRDTPNPPQSSYGRDAAGNLTGRLNEPPAFLALGKAAPQVTDADMMVRVRRLFDRAASVGCTALHDCSIGNYAGVRDVPFLTDVMKSSPPIRLRGMLVSNLMDDWEKTGIKPGHGDDMFRIDGVKAWSDGSGPGLTAYHRENYLGQNSRGALNYTAEELTKVIRRAHQAGWQLGVHAIGDAAIDMTIDCYASVLHEFPRADHRHRIEHCSFLHPEQITRMAEIKLSPSFFPSYMSVWGKFFRDEAIGERACFIAPYASAQKAGLRPSSHSDYSVTPIDPLGCVQDVATRIMNDGGEVLGPDERVSVEAALRTVTVDAAWQCRMDDIAGSLEPGKYADLVLLEKDPTAIDPTTIRKIKVSETWLAGERRHTGQ